MSTTVDTSAETDDVTETCVKFTFGPRSYSSEDLKTQHGILGLLILENVTGPR